jgi:uncharacterized protein (DUF983 family)
MNAALRQRALFFRRVLARHCPQCGSGDLFRRWARLHERCSVCGLIYRRESGSMIGSMYLSAIATEFVAAAIALGLFFGTSWTPAVALSVGLALHLAFAAWFFPYSMSLWVAVEYATDVQNGEWWARPR